MLASQQCLYAHIETLAELVSDPRIQAACGDPPYFSYMPRLSRRRDMFARHARPPHTGPPQNPRIDARPSSSNPHGLGHVLHQLRTRAVLVAVASRMILTLKVDTVLGRSLHSLSVQSAPSVLSLLANQEQRSYTSSF